MSTGKRIFILVIIIVLGGSMLKFSSFGSSNSKYPKKTYDGQEDQSYGFNPSRKLQSGALRGEQRIDGSVILNKGSFVVNDGSDDRFFAGKDTDGSVKIKLSQNGYDVKTATDDQLVWTSDFNSFKIVESGSVVMPSGSAPSLDFGGSNYTLTTADNYTKKPIVLCFDSQGTMLTEALDIYNSTFDATYYKISLSRIINFSFALPNQFTIQITWNNAQGSTYNFSEETIYYYLLQETSLPD